MLETTGKNGGAAAVAERMPGCTVLVVGDVMLDEYIVGPVDRISPEAPVPVVNVRETDLRLGGAANVTHNIQALGGKAILAGVVGRDAMGERLIARLEEGGVETRGMVVDDQRPTTVKTRVIAHAQQIVRYDRESRAGLAPELADKIVAFVEAELSRIDAMVLSDYAKGVLGHGLGGALIERFRVAGKPVLADPKIKNFESYRHATVITPNFKEAVEAAAVHAGIHVETQEQLERAAQDLLQRMQCEHLVVTKGEEGMYLFTVDAEPVHIPTAAREVYDVSGAGDTVIASLGLGLAAGATLRQAAVVANHAAGVVVGKFGTAVVSHTELMSALQER
jgi:D-beta-D-heptose 7-phosphate kinase/D-beta-D-heptose 1-phosphate adenosyltransferase